MDMVERARVFATAAHAAVKQVRKYTYEPYIVHPAEVASIVATRPHDPEMLAAAWLHDVVEDTGVSLESIRAEFSTKVVTYVDFLTNPSRPEDGNRAVRKAIDRDWIASAPAEVKTVKLADLISNCSSIVMHDANFAKTYLEEKRLMLEVLKDGDSVLWERAASIVRV